MDKIALFGRQILEAVGFLRKQGFDSLGHVHTGNIFVVSSNLCKLGGYENALLGYKTKVYKRCVEVDCVNSIDVVMFGKNKNCTDEQVIFNFSIKRKLDVCFPEMTAKIERSL